MQPPSNSIAERMGRGKIRDSRSRSLGTKVTMQEEKELARAAAADGKSASEWARDVLLREARRSKDDAVFTELVATRMLLVNLIKPLILGEKVSPTWITEAMTMVRKEKHKAAQDVMQQYTQDAGKEK
ncbi:MAG TPA: hypothetical protein VMU57_21500 [Edaphobacter sp.]|uniref:hypothetical protein n=1 Tax=Edaphobacter sp. TaxID=1934404 RepID=UPI002BA04592|nr:hypothetical protein [Edaphobacter sp.]HUZ97489.1 hypothetical protein [Edaphobacter sp.]